MKLEASLPGWQAASVPSRASCVTSKAGNSHSSSPKIVSFFLGVLRTAIDQIRCVLRRFCPLITLIDANQEFHAASPPRAEMLFECGVFSHCFSSHACFDLKRHEDVPQKLSGKLCEIEPDFFPIRVYSRDSRVQGSVAAEPRRVLCGEIRARISSPALQKLFIQNA